MAAKQTNPPPKAHQIFVLPSNFYVEIYRLFLMTSEREGNCHQLFYKKNPPKNIWRVYSPFGAMGALFKKPPINIVAVGEKHQRDQQKEPKHLGVFHELVVGLAAGGHFIQKEHHVPAVQGRNWEDVHKRQNNGDKSRGCPKLLPVPSIGK